MATKERLYDLDDLWALYCQRENDHLKFELIDGEIIEMSGPGGVHGRIAIRLGRYLDIFAEDNNLGIVTAETGYHPPGDRYNLLLPDVAFISYDRAPEPFPDRLVPAMPELAVEIKSPSNSIAELRDKARLYLRLGSRLVWLVLPDERSVDVCAMTDAGEMSVERLPADESLTGGGVLPGFRLEVSRVFA